MQTSRIKYLSEREEPRARAVIGKTEEGVARASGSFGARCRKRVSGSIVLFKDNKF